jgi:hypothetical protein
MDKNNYTLSDYHFSYWEECKFDKRILNIDFEEYVVEGEFTPYEFFSKQYLGQYKGYCGYEDSSAAFYDDECYDCGDCTKCVNHLTIKDLLSVFFEEKYLECESITQDLDLYVEYAMSNEELSKYFTPLEHAMFDEELSKYFTPKDSAKPIDIASINAFYYRNRLYSLENTTPIYNIVNGCYLKDRLTPINEEDFVKIGYRYYSKSSIEKAQDLQVVQIEYEYYLKNEIENLKPVDAIGAYYEHKYNIYLKSSLKKLDPKEVVTIKYHGQEENEYYHFLDKSIDDCVELPKDAISGTLCKDYIDKYCIDCFFEPANEDSVRYVNYSHMGLYIQSESGYMEEATDYIGDTGKFLVDDNSCLDMGDIYTKDSIFLKTASGDFMKFTFSDLNLLFYEDIEEAENIIEVVCYNDEYYFADESSIVIDEYIYFDDKYYEMSKDIKPIDDDIVEYNGKAYREKDLQKLDFIKIIKDTITGDYYIKEDNSACIDDEDEIVYSNGAYYKLPDKLIPCKGFDFKVVKDGYANDNTDVYNLNDVIISDEDVCMEYRELIEFKLHCEYCY